MSYINIGKLTEEVNNIKGHEVIEFQAPTATNGYTWYRKYADGWVEQGGESAQAGTAVVLPVTMANTVYYATCLSKNATDTAAVEMHLSTRTTTSVLFTCSYNGSSSYTSEVCVWEVKGMYA